MNEKTYKLNKKSAPKIAIFLAAMLAVIKAIAGFLSGSLAVLSSAMDSMLDILASSINYFMIKKADEPPDEGHNFGHGKFESYASFLQSILIFGTGFFLLYHAFGRLIAGSHPQITPVAITVMLISMIVSFVITLMLRFTAKREGSIALHADAAHYSMDLLTNLAILLALLLIKFTGFLWVDAVFAIIASLYIMYSALKIHITALKIILDAKIPEEKLSEIKKVLDRYAPFIINYHRLRARTDGYKIFVDVHLLLPQELTLAQAHDLCDIIEHEMPPNIDMTIHAESSPNNSQKRDAILRFLEEKQKNTSSA